MLKKHKFSFFLMTGFLAIILTVAGCSSKKDILQEISGMWQDNQDNGTVEIQLAGDAKAITVEGKSYPVSVESIEKNKNIVNLKVQNGSGKPELWAIRQIWDDNGNGFTLAIHQGEGNKVLSRKKQAWYAQCRNHLRQLDEWLRRKLRCYRLKQRKRTKPIADFLMEQGVPEWRSWLLALSGKGWWRMSGTPQANEAMSIQWFEKAGLINLTNRYLWLTR
jgi:hypothetical protein